MQTPGERHGQADGEKLYSVQGELTSSAKVGNPWHAGWLATFHFADRACELAAPSPLAPGRPSPTCLSPS